MKKFLALFMSLCMILALAAGCGNNANTPGGNEGNTDPGTPSTPAKSSFSDGYPENYLRVAMGDDMSTADVMMTTGDYMIPLNIYDTLVECDVDDNGVSIIAGALAESWDISEDGKDYTFHLRHGVKFHNGEELKADDVLYSVYRMMDPERSCVNDDVYDMLIGASEYLDGEVDEIAGVEVVDDYTVIYHLEQAYAPFLANLAVPGGAIYNRKACDEADAAGGGKDSTLFGSDPAYTIGTGPFILKDWQINDHIELVRNDNYWKDEIADMKVSDSVGGIIFFIIGDSSTLKMKFDNGDLDLLDLDDCREAIADYETSDTYKDQVYHTTRLGTYYYCVNMNVPGLDNVLVRKAIQRGIDRQSLLDNLYYGTGVLANSILAPGMVGYTKLPEIKYDVAEAQSLMQQAGYSAENPLHVGISQSSDSSSVTLNINEAVQQMLKDIYIEAEIVSVDDASWSAIRADGGMDMYETSWSADFNDPDNFIYTFFSHANAKTRGFNYNNNEVMDKVEQARFMSDVDARMKLYSEIEEQIVTEDAAWIPLFHLEHCFVMSPRVDADTFSPNWAGWSSMCMRSIAFN